MLCQTTRQTLSLSPRRIVTHHRRSSTTIPPPFVPSTKNPTRGGQDLGNRYRRLEKALRGKDSYQRNINELSEDGTTLPLASRRSTRTFLGYLIPEEPKPPASEDCCMSGCAICVYDLYEEAIDEYKKAADNLRTSLTMLRIPQEQWPEEIRLQELKATHKPTASLSAFEELEARLRERHAATSKSEPAGL
ncbi:hypothetical protein BC835DRAFT_1419174 [Cytidiella melzeri]|nr:hypothetical protein BC835DRAFT_1419174 [Cytidiella melzeri]